jgi:hypothetical protein
VEGPASRTVEAAMTKEACHTFQRGLFKQEHYALAEC